MDAAVFEQVYGAFQDFHAYFAPLFGRREAREHSRHYLQALLVQSGERRNAEKLSETVPASARGMQRFPAASPWDDDAVIGRLQECLSPRLGHPEAVWALDGSDFPKQGRKSAGVARQYCGRLGRETGQGGQLPGRNVPGLRQSVGPGVSKERIFESTIIIPTRKRPKSNKKSASAGQKVKKPTGRPEKTLRRRGAAAGNSPGSTVSDQVEENAAHQDGKGYEQLRRKNPDRAAHHRRQEQERRQKAKECGQCRDCKNPSIPGKTRCEVCAARHRMSGKQARERKAQQKEQISGQDPIS